MQDRKATPPLDLMRVAPLFPVASGVILGILFDRAATPPWVIYLVLLTLGTAGMLLPPLRGRGLLVWMLVGGVSVGGLLHLVDARRIRADSIEHYADESGVLARLRGTVVHEPRQLAPPKSAFQTWAHRTRRTGFVLAVGSIAEEGGEISASGYVRVTVLEALLDLAEGERVEVFGRLYPLRPRDNPGSFDWAGYFRSQGIVARMNCQHREAVRRLGGDEGAHRRGWVSAIRRGAAHLLIDGVAVEAEGTDGLLEGLVLGQRTQVDRTLNELFIRAGCIHFLAVSGVHLVIVMWLARTVVRVLGGGGRAAILAMMGAIVTYAVLAEPRPPILRASIIGVIYCVACLLHRQRSCLNWISACVIVLAVWRPAVVFDVGFQLSTAAVLGVRYLTPALHLLAARILFWVPSSVEEAPSFGSSGRVRRCLRFTRWWLVRGSSITAAAWLAGLPIVALVFHRVYLWGALGSLLLMPVVTLVMTLSFTKIIVGVVSPAGGTWLGAGLEWLTRGLVAVVDCLGELPGASVTVPEPPWTVVGFYYVALTLVVLAAQPRAGNVVYEGRSEAEAEGATILPRWPSAVALVALGIAVAVWQYPTRESDRLRVSVLSVGRGSSTVIQFPTGETILYDAGSSYASDPGTSTIAPFLLHRGIRRVERIFVSHPNLDHFSGVLGVLDSIDAGVVSLNRYFEARSRPHSLSRKLLTLLGERGVSIEPIEGIPRTWDYGEATVECLWPESDLGDAYTINDTSTVLRLRYGGHSVLVTGDIEEAAQRRLIARGGLASDVLLLPHHGSVTRSTVEFMAAVNPSIVIRSSNERMRETLNGLEALTERYRLFNTADDGAIEVVVERGGITVATALGRGARPGGR